MPKIIVLPAIEDQIAFDEGHCPENHFLHEFTTAEERESYVDGLQAMDDLVEYEILSDRGLAMSIAFDGNKTDLAFENEARKTAYLQGIEDGDGFVRPRYYIDDEPEFDTLVEMVSSPPAP